MEDCYRSGLAWLAHSGVQTESGGLSRYYRGDIAEYQNISTEITAYGILGYMQLPLVGETGLLSNALRAGQFLCYDAWDLQSGLFPFEVSRSGPREGGRVYLFDCGIIIRALLELTKITSDPMYLQRAERCGAAMLDRMWRVDGSFFPFLDLASGLPSQGSDHWSLEPGVHQLKVGLAFQALAEMTSSGLFSDTAEHLLQNCLRQHEMFLPGHSDPARVADRLHAYCYFLEGLLPFVEKRYECAQVLQAGINRVQTLLEKTRPALERCDVIAQLLRLRLLCEYIGIIEIDSPAASREAEILPTFQMKTDDRRTNGAFSFGRRDGELLAHANPVATIFALQALRLWKEYQNGELRTTWHGLI